MAPQERIPGSALGSGRVLVYWKKQDICEDEREDIRCIFPKWLMLNLHNVSWHYIIGQVKRGELYIL